MAEETKILTMLKMGLLDDVKKGVLDLSVEDLQFDLATNSGTLNLVVTLNTNRGDHIHISTQPIYLTNSSFVGSNNHVGMLSIQLEHLFRQMAVYTET